MRYIEDQRAFQRLTIPCYDTDAAFCLKPAAFMDMAQELAYFASRQMGFGYEDLQRHHAAWVLSRMHFRYDRVPRWGDPVLLSTWHKGQDGLFFLRDFALTDPDGASLVSCTSSWLIIDTETRRLVRDPIGEGLMHRRSEVPLHAIEEPCPKVALPRGAAAEPVGDHVVAYSDIDILGHTNNARYIAWAMDCIDYGTAAARRVSDVYINFNRETRPGETVRLHRLRSDIGGQPVYQVEGRVDGHPSFCAQLSFQTYA